HAGLRARDRGGASVCRSLRTASGHPFAGPGPIGGIVRNRSVRLAGSLLAAALALPGRAGAPARRVVTLDDLARLRDVSEPSVSPDGAWVAYVVGSPDQKEDRKGRDLWMTSWDGKRTLQLTSGPSRETTPR